MLKMAGLLERSAERGLTSESFDERIHQISNTELHRETGLNWMMQCSMQ